MKSVLVIAYACSPYQGSEAGVGWGIINELVKFYSLTVFVEEIKFKADIERYLFEHPTSLVAKSVTFIFIPKKRNRFLRTLFPPSYYIFYRQWHRRVFNYIRNSPNQNNFLLAHQLTMVGFREPGFCYQLDIPFVIGPVGGAGYLRFSDFQYLDFYGKIYYTFYNLVNYLTLSFYLRPRKAWRKACADGVCGVLAADSTNFDAIKKHTSIVPLLIPEVGPPDLTEFDYDKYSSESSNPQVLKLIWIGSVENRKGLVVALRALRMFNKPYQLDVYGSGPLENSLKRFSLQHRLNVTFHGQQDRNTVLRKLVSADFLLFTSLRDLTATVIIESLSLNTPVIYFDRGGYTPFLTSPEHIFVQDTSEPLHISLLKALFVAFDRSITHKSASYPLERSYHCSLDWDHKAKLISNIYKLKITNHFYRTRSNDILD